MPQSYSAPRHSNSSALCFACVLHLYVYTYTRCFSVPRLFSCSVYNEQQLQIFTSSLFLAGEAGYIRLILSSLVLQIGTHMACTRPREWGVASCRGSHCPNRLIHSVAPAPAALLQGWPSPLWLAT